MLNFEKILKSLKSGNPEVFAPLFKKHFKKLSDEDQIRLLANVLAETGNLSTFRESGYYTSPDRLRSVFPSVFVRGGYNANNYVKNSEKLFNLIYSNKFKPALGNGDVASGEGFKYRGGGGLQTTGKHNYKVLSDISGIDFVKNPELITEPENVVISAISFWNANKVSSKKTLKDVRVAINGSSFGYDEFVKYYNKIKGVL